MGITAFGRVKMIGEGNTSLENAKLMQQNASRKFILCEIFSHPGITVVLIASVSNKRVHPSVKHEDFTISKILNLSKINCQKS